jgi:hypothetical protein
VFGPILESSGLFLCSLVHPGGEVNDARVSAWRDCFVMSLLGSDFFPRGVVRWTG